MSWANWEKIKDRLPAVLSRRDWMRLAAAGVGTATVSGWLERLAAETVGYPGRRCSCILLWMTGGPSQTDTFDMKPGHANGGSFKEIQTAVPGLRFSEHLPRLARQADKLVLVRSMNTKEGDHGRATYLLRTGYLPQGPIQYPTLGSLVAHELTPKTLDLPSFVSIAPFRDFNPGAYSSGFLGPQYAPLVVGETRLQPAARLEPASADQGLKVQDLDAPPGIPAAQLDARIDILRGLEREFVADRPGTPPLSHQTAYERAVRLMRSAASRAFNLEEEPESLRDLYGRNPFGQGCLLARRLVERGVPFVEVSLGGTNPNEAVAWDTHAQNFETVRRLCTVLDPAWAALLSDLDARGLLSSTLIVWMGEFGRTPQINPQRGRDHFPTAWSTVLAGGGLKTGQVIGKTSPDGMTVVDRPVSVTDLLATVCSGLGIDSLKQNMSNVGRPIRIVDKSAKPIQEILG